MKRYCGRIRLLGIILGLVLPILTGCGVLHGNLRGDRPAARLEISLDALTPEGVDIAWDPAVMTVESAEVSVSGGSGESPGAVVVTVRLQPEG